MLIDTHAHLNFLAFDKDREKIIKKCLENDIWMINIGTNYETSKKAVKIAENYPQGVFASVGLHPINLDTGLVKVKFDEREGSYLEKEFDFKKYKKLAKSKKVVAIGEIGLDYYWKPKTTKKKELFKEKQKDLLLKQLKLAQELKLPVIFHCRMAHQDLIEFLSENPETRPKRAVAHGFVGNLQELQKYLDFRFYIGFNGIIFSALGGPALGGKLPLDEVIKQCPLDKILIETDCPYLTPPSEGKDKRNEPIFVKHVAKRISELKGTNFEQVCEETSKNARNLFGI